MNKNRYVAYIAALCALAVAINIIENIFIPPLGFGIRFGLANIISLVAIKMFGKKEMGFVVLTRLTLGNLIKGSIFGTPFWISSMGILLSSLVIIVLDKIGSSLLFTSMMSSVFHTFGQVLVVSFLYNEINMFMLFPLLIITSLSTGVLTGLISEKTIKRIEKIIIK